jgi:hypothetical protein
MCIMHLAAATPCPTGDDTYVTAKSAPRTSSSVLEATLKGVFDLQNASFAATRSLLEHWEAAVEQTQEALLESLQSRLHSASRSAESGQ